MPLAVNATLDAALDAAQRGCHSRRRSPRMPLTEDAAHRRCRSPKMPVVTADVGGRCGRWWTLRTLVVAADVGGSCGRCGHGRCLLPLPVLELVRIEGLKDGVGCGERSHNRRGRPVKLLPCLPLTERWLDIVPHIGTLIAQRCFLRTL